MNCSQNSETRTANGVVELKAQQSSRWVLLTQPLLDVQSQSAGEYPWNTLVHLLLSKTPTEACLEAQKYLHRLKKQSNAKMALSSQHRRTRSMSLPSSLSILTVSCASPIYNLLASPHLDRFLRSCDYRLQINFRLRPQNRGSIALVALMHN
jgi:hypothetical protein